VTLIGFGLGARVIMVALQHLSEMGEEGKGIVETAIVMGAPFTADTKVWDQIGNVVAHRLVNVYCTTDWVLGLAYRASQLTVKGVAGLQAVNSALVENIDVTGIVGGHWDYRQRLVPLVKLVGLNQSKGEGKLTTKKIAEMAVMTMSGTLPPVPGLSKVAQMVEKQSGYSLQTTGWHTGGSEPAEAVE